MVDKDLAELYEVQTRNLNKALGRSLKRFPDEDFMLQLTDEKFKNLMFQNGTSSWAELEPPYVFTDQGFAMLSGILNSDRTISLSLCS